MVAKLNFFSVYPRIVPRCSASMGILEADLRGLTRGFTLK